MKKFFNAKVAAAFVMAAAATSLFAFNSDSEPALIGSSNVAPVSSITQISGDFKQIITPAVVVTARATLQLTPAALQVTRAASTPQVVTTIFGGRNAGGVQVVLKDATQQKAQQKMKMLG